MKEFELIGRLLAPIARASAARGLKDDVAVWPCPAGRDLVLTKDMMAEGVHFRSADPPETIAAKLLRVNLSDLAAKGAKPEGVLLGLGLTGRQDETWLQAFVQGLAADLDRFNTQLWGGDTISGVGRLTLSLTAIGTVASGRALSRAGAKVGDGVYVTGTIGDAWLGLEVLEGRLDVGEAIRSHVVAAYQLPEPRTDLGPALAGLAHASADISDGLLADAGHIAEASDVAIQLEGMAIPLSLAGEAWAGADISRRMHLATAGDDYEIVFTAPLEQHEAVLALYQRFGVRVTLVGRVVAGRGLTVLDQHGATFEVTRRGYEHGGAG